jgi:oligopeptide transport system ATP-binding protein
MSERAVLPGSSATAAPGGSADPRPAGERPGTAVGDVLVEARNLSVSFPRHRSFVARMRGQAQLSLHAVDSVDLILRRGESLALVGESGSGKSTLARALMGLQSAESGEVRLEGRVLPAKRSRADSRRMQMVFQDPYSSLNPRLTVGAMLRELLAVHGIGDHGDREKRVRDLLGTVGLAPSAYDAYPRQFSGGQRQRVAIARALVLSPDILIADEPVSALDVSVQATILNLLDDITDSLGLTMLFVAHNLAVVRHLCDWTAVMYLGRIIEIAPTEQLFRDPRHPYTQGLLRAIPRLVPGVSTARIGVQGDPPSPFAIPSGCRFHPRCPMATERCRTEDPALAGLGSTGSPARTDGPGGIPGAGAVPVAIGTAAATERTHVAACHYAFAPHPAEHTPEVARGVRPG